MVNHPSLNISSGPLLLVDIDGVLNAFQAWPLTAHQRTAMAGGYRVVLDVRHPGWFDVLARHAEVRWATMWQANAGPIFGRVAGLGTDWDYLDFDSAWTSQTARRRTGLGVGSYKWPLIKPLGAGDRPLVWIDDDMTDEQLGWAGTRNAAGRPTLFVRPDPAEGFSEVQYEHTLAFLQAHQVGTNAAHDEPDAA